MSIDLFPYNYNYSWIDGFLIIDYPTYRKPPTPEEVETAKRLNNEVYEPVKKAIKDGTLPVVQVLPLEFAHLRHLIDPDMVRQHVTLLSLEQAMSTEETYVSPEQQELLDSIKRHITRFKVQHDELQEMITYWQMQKVLPDDAVMIISRIRALATSKLEEIRNWLAMDSLSDDAINGWKALETHYAKQVESCNKLINKE